MKKSVYDYIRNHPDASIRDIASAVNKPELDVLRAVTILHEEKYVTLSRIIPLSLENSDSCRYSVTGKQYSSD